LGAHPGMIPRGPKPFEPSTPAPVRPRQRSAVEATPCPRHARRRKSAAPTPGCRRRWRAPQHLLLPLSVRRDNDGSRRDRDDRNVQRESCGRKGPLTQHPPPARLPQRHTHSRVRSHLLRYETDRPTPGRNPIARASIRTAKPRAPYSHLTKTPGGLVAVAGQVAMTGMAILSVATTAAGRRSRCWITSGSVRTHRRDAPTRIAGDRRYRESAHRNRSRFSATSGRFALPGRSRHRSLARDNSRPGTTALRGCQRYNVGRFVADAEAIYSYEGTCEMNTLIVGRALTGHSAFV
jgi:hypothetical protein